MSAVALLLALAAPAGATDHALVCTQKTEGNNLAKSFRFAFSVDGSAVNTIAVDDPQNVLDPFGRITVYEYGSGGMSKGAPPKPKLKFTGSATGNAFVFKSADKALSITLMMAPGEDGGFTYSFDATRRMDSTMTTDYSGTGSCKAA